MRKRIGPVRGFSFLSATRLVQTASRLMNFANAKPATPAATLQRVNLALLAKNLLVRFGDFSVSTFSLRFLRMIIPFGWGLHYNECKICENI